MRILPIILAALTAQTVMVSCGNEKEAVLTEEDITGTSSEESGDSTVDENGFLKDDLPEDLNFLGREVILYVRGDTLETEFDSESTGEVVGDSLYYRNLAIEERMNVDLTFFSNTSADFWGTRGMFMDTVRSAVMAQDNSMDIVAGLSVMMPVMAQEGNFYNLTGADVEYLDFSKPWWPSNLIDEISIGDRMYFASGEASLGVIKGMECFYFNKNLITDMNMEDPYELVSSGKWTLDKFNEMASSAYIDKNGDGTVDARDQFGFIIQNENHAISFIEASGLRLAERDIDGIPQLLYDNSHIVDLIDRMKSVMDQPGFATALDNTTTYSTVFMDGLALFATGEFSTAQTYRDLEFDFGIIPYPKYDETQEHYSTTSRTTFSGLAIPICADLNTSAAVLEAFASESYRQVTPAYYESALKVKYSRDDISAVMFDLIKDGVSYDFGIVYGVILEYSPGTPITTALRWMLCGAEEKINGNWSSLYASVKNSIEYTLSSYIETIMDLGQ